MSIASEFKAFILRGNVVDLAVGVMIGAAFTSVVNSFVKDILTPFISIPGTVNFSDIAFQIGASRFMIGNFLNAVISFIIVAIVLFFFVVRPVGYLMARAKPDVPEPATTRECPYCLSKVPLKANKCAFCASNLEPVAGQATMPS